MTHAFRFGDWTAQSSSMTGCLQGDVNTLQLREVCVLTNAVLDMLLWKICFKQMPYPILHVQSLL